ncbi:saccharopine dehydrogenase family protein [Marinicella sediminis]|uniref:Saccharopine dehydrogenase family protein n=1 Tax=Marinicella sediminis TaxID=1792834 RepID=A0ABV7J8T0_9GAMM|nr:saccharopine dehydrogenase NADP-binding domain-containing protein [Marinicella sediminis]
MTQQRYDVIVFGATSFVGKIICQYLVSHFKSGDISWAMAARSADKLDQLKTQLGPAAQDLAVLVVDATDEQALGAMCRRTRVLMTTVGPYDLYGEPVLRACVETGTDYCDLTGEAHWIRKMLDRYEEQAKQTGARIVHCTGFDSIPSDLGVHHLQREARRIFGTHCCDVKLRIRRMKGSASGGTVATALNMAKQIKADPSVKKIMANPYALCPEDHGFSVRQQRDKIQYDASCDSWVGPFFMASINTRIVHRSNALSKQSYGSDFTYHEGVMTGKGWSGKNKARGIYWSLAAFFTGASLSPIRSFMAKFLLPKPGEGPTPEAQEAGFYDFRFIGTTAAGQQITTKVYGDKDPGYGSTAQIMSQAAVCLANDVPAHTAGGFWTPATLMGDVLIDRLHQHAGLTFEVLSTQQEE